MKERIISEEEERGTRQETYLEIEIEGTGRDLEIEADFMNRSTPKTDLIRNSDPILREMLIRGKDLRIRQDRWIEIANMEIQVMTTLWNLNLK